MSISGLSEGESVFWEEPYTSTYDSYFIYHCQSG